MDKSIQNEIVDSMVSAILAELVSNLTELDPLDIGLETENLVRVLKEQKVEVDPEKDIYFAWNDAYDNVVHGDGEYWEEEYGLYGEEVEVIIDKNENKIIKKVLSLLK